VVFTKDEAFDSPSGAARVVYGCNVSGPRYWRQATTGQRYGDWRASQIGGGSRTKEQERGISKNRNTRDRRKTERAQLRADIRRAIEECQTADKVACGIVSTDILVISLAAIKASYKDPSCCGSLAH
jgi:hypothetical protein